MRAVLADENFPRSVALGLAAVGHDVEMVAAQAPGLDDTGVLALARAQHRCLLTFDADFGELVFYRSAPPPPVILYFRIHPVVTSELLELSLRALEAAPEGTFCVVTREGTRIRPFPPDAPATTMTLAPTAGGLP